MRPNVIVVLGLAGLALGACVHSAPSLSYETGAIIRAFDDPESVLKAHDRRVLDVLASRGYSVRVVGAESPPTPHIAGGSAIIGTLAETGGRDSLVVTLEYYRSRDDRDPVNPFGTPQSNAGFRYRISVSSCDATGKPIPVSPRARADADSIAVALRS